MFKKRAMYLHGLTRCGNRTRRSLLVTSRHSQTAGNRRPFGPQLCRAGQLFATCLEALHRRRQRLSVCSETPATSTGKCSFSLVISRTTLANACTSAHAPYMSQASRKSKNPANPDADNRLAPFQCSSNLPGRVHKKIAASFQVQSAQTCSIRYPRRPFCNPRTRPNSAGTCAFLSTEVKFRNRFS